MNGRVVSPEKKDMMRKRKTIQDKVSRIYNRLVKECFPSFLDETAFPEREVPGMDEIPVEKSANDRFSLHDFDNLTISTRVVHLIQEPAEPQTDSDVEKDIALFFDDVQTTKNKMYTDE